MKNPSKYLLPSLLRNSTYEEFFDCIDLVLDDFVDNKVKPIKDVLSIKNSSLDSLKEIAKLYFQFDDKIYDNVVFFLQNEFTEKINKYENNIKKFIGLFFNINLVMQSDRIRVQLDRSISQEAVSGLVEYLRNEFSDEVVSISCSTRNEISFDFMGESYNETEWWFLIHNAIIYYILQNSQFSNDFEVMCNEEDYKNYCLSFDYNKEAYQFNIIFNDNVRNLTKYDDLGNLIASYNPIEDDFDNIFNFIKEYILFYNKIEKNDAYKSINIVYSTANEICLYKLKEEISKIPYSIAKRGTLAFYSSLFGTLGYKYDLIISLMRSVNVDRVSRLIADLDLENHHKENNITKFVDVESLNNWSGHLDKESDFTNILDSELNKPEDEKIYRLDSQSNYAILDQSNKSDNTFFNRHIFIGLNLTENYFSKNIVFPTQLSQMYSTLLDLNKKATDVCFLSIVLSLNIEAVNSAKIIRLKDSYGFLEVTSFETTFDEDRPLILKFYENDECIYESLIPNPVVYKNRNSIYVNETNTCYLTTMAHLRSEKYQFTEIENDSLFFNRHFDLNDYKKYLTKDIVFKLYSEETKDLSHPSPEQNYYLFRQNESGNFEMIVGPTNDVEITYNGMEVTFNKTQGSFGNGEFTRLEFSSLKNSISSISSIKLWNDESNSNLLYSLDVKDKSGKTGFIEVFNNMNLTVITTKHEKQVIDSIEITTAPNKVDYIAGETFDPTGIEVTVYEKEGN